MEIRIAGVVEESFVDGPGIRFAVFVQGCPHHCENCHNPETHDFSGGCVVDTDSLFEQCAENPLQGAGFKSYVLQRLDIRGAYGEIPHRGGREKAAVDTGLSR